jgi:uncharacterized protein (DUF305 family)
MIRRQFINVRALSKASLLLSLTLTALSGAMVGCSDDDSDQGGDGGEPAQSAGSSSGGTAGQSTAGTHSGGMHVGGSTSAAGNGTAIGGMGGDAAAGALAVAGDRRIPYTPTNDVEFVEFFIMHHQMAIDMAEHEVAHGSAADVKAMAQAVIDAQAAEIETLMTIREQLDGEIAPPPEDPHAVAEMQAMENMSGAELDAMFLLEMIPHHASALGPAHRALPYLENATLKEMATDIINVQAREIGELRTRLLEEGTMGAGEDHASASAGRADFGLEGDRRVPLTPEDDVTFIDFFVPHHQMAIEMADHVIAHGSDPAVKDMATAMKETQASEIELMLQKREELTGSAEPEPMPADPHAMDEMEEMTQLEGAELDEMFLREMIVHHSTALPTSHRTKPHVMDAELRELADTMFDDQAREVGEMQEMLDL